MTNTHNLEVVKCYGATSTPLVLPLDPLDPFVWLRSWITTAQAPPRSSSPRTLDALMWPSFLHIPQRGVCDSRGDRGLVDRGSGTTSPRNTDQGGSFLTPFQGHWYIQERLNFNPIFCKGTSGFGGLTNTVHSFQVPCSGYLSCNSVKNLQVSILSPPNYFFLQLRLIFSRCGPTTFRVLLGCNLLQPFRVRKAILELRCTFRTPSCWTRRAVPTALGD